MHKQQIEDDRTDFSKELVSKICKWLLKINTKNKKKNSREKRWSKGMNRNFIEEKFRPANKCMNVATSYW